MNEGILTAFYWLTDKKQYLLVVSVNGEMGSKVFELVD